MVMVRLSSRSRVRLPSRLCTQLASSTMTCATVTGSGPPFTTLTSMTPNWGSRIRSTVSSSTGGKLWRNTPAGPVRRNTATRMASRTRGASPLNQSGIPVVDEVSILGSDFRTSGILSSGIGRPHQEDSAPTQFGELALVGVEHEWARMLVGELEDSPLPLTEGHDVCPFVALQIGSGSVRPEKIAVHVERVQEVELGDVD